MDENGRRAKPGEGEPAKRSSKAKDADRGPASSMSVSQRLIAVGVGVLLAGTAIGFTLHQQLRSTRPSAVAEHHAATPRSAASRPAASSGHSGQAEPHAPRRPDAAASAAKSHHAGRATSAHAFRHSAKSTAKHRKKAHRGTRPGHGAAAHRPHAAKAHHGGGRHHDHGHSREDWFPEDAGPQPVVFLFWG